MLTILYISLQVI